MSDEKKKLGDAIFVDIDSNEYLNEIHEKILFNYALRLFQLETKGKAKLQAICGDLPSVDSIDDSKAKLKVVADSTGYDFGNLISILTTSFIKTKNEDYQCILALLRSIIER